MLRLRYAASVTRSVATREAGCRSIQLEPRRTIATAHEASGQGEQLKGGAAPEELAGDSNPETTASKTSTSKASTTKASTSKASAAETRKRRGNLPRRTSRTHSSQHAAISSHNHIANTADRAESPRNVGPFTDNRNLAASVTQLKAVPAWGGSWTSMKDRLTAGANAAHGAPTATDSLAEKVVYQEGLVIPLSEDNVIPVPDVEQPADPSRPPTTEKLPPKPRPSTKRKSQKEAPVLNVKKILPKNLKLVSVEEESTLPVPKLCHDLDRVLFNPGVYAMQDPRSRVFNFDPYLASIMPVEEFDFDALNEYKTSSKDAKLHALAVKYGSKYNGSTSSMTSMLSHFHYLISAWRTPTFDSLAQSYTPDSFNFTQLTRTPAATFLRYKDGVYAIDADKAYDTQNVLSQLGRSMEKLLTLPKEDFEKYRRTESHQLSESERGQAESYHYTTMGDFLMRSQLDAKDARLPGSGVFDLKTRAVVTVRMNVHGYKAGAGYEIRKRHGQWESFDREYSDMIRAAFLKYSLQVRMGRMDGIFVAYHNTQRIFGFQYISLLEMDHAIHGSNNMRVGDQEFKGSLSMLNDLLNKATERFPGKSLRLHVEAGRPKSRSCTSSPNRSLRSSLTRFKSHRSMK